MSRHHITGHLDDKTSRKTIAKLREMHSEDPEADWEITISSEGGVITSGAAIYSEIYSHSLRGKGTHHVTTKVRGQAASAAALVFQAGDHRVLGKLDRILLHEPNLSCESMTLKEVEEWIDELREWMNLYVEVHLERSDVSAEEINEKARGKDWIIHGREAIIRGLADSLG